MKITDISATTVSIPVSRPTMMSTRTLGIREYLLVEVACSDSEEVGVGYSYAGTSGGLMLGDAVNDLLRPMLQGAESDDILGLWERMYQETLLVGRRGGVIRAISAVDMALWDLAAKCQNVPLAVLLGGSARAVPAYASGGYYRPDEGPWEGAVTAEIEFNRSLGFTHHKIKVGGLPFEEDAARVKAAIAAVGPGGRLALDANNAYRDVPDALRALRAFEEVAGDNGIWWLEEPFAPDDVAKHAELTRKTETRIATGEIHQTRWEFKDLIEQNACDLLQPDAGVMGGITEWMNVAKTAATFDIPVAPHWHANVHAHLAAATPNCIAIEHFALEKDLYNFEQLLDPATRLTVKDGWADVPDRPGIGIAFDPDAVQKYRLVR